MSVSKFILGGPYWLRGAKIGGVLFVAIFACLFIPLYGWIVVIYATVLPLAMLENIFGGLDLIHEFDGGIFTFGFVLPNTYGWLTFFALLLVFGVALGYLFGLIRNPVLKFLIPFFVIFLSVSFLIFLNTSRSPVRCALVFDGMYNNNKSECYLTAVKRGYSPSTEEFCNSHIGPSLRSKCMYEVVDTHRELASISFCDKMDGTPKFECLKLVAWQQNDITVCDLIPRQAGNTSYNTPDGERWELKEDCYLDVAKNSDDATLCDVPISQDTRDKCYLDKGICEKVVYDYNKSICRSSHVQIPESEKEFELLPLKADDEVISFTLAAGQTNAFIRTTYNPENLELSDSSHIAYYTLFSGKKLGGLSISNRGPGDGSRTTEEAFRSYSTPDYPAELVTIGKYTYIRDSANSAVVAYTRYSKGRYYIQAHFLRDSDVSQAFFETFLSSVTYKFE